MQKISTRIFICASLAFGVFGIVNVLTLPENDNMSTPLHTVFMKLMFISVFIILTSFALSVASRYLNEKS